MRLARQHNLQQRGACLVRPKLQHNPLNPPSLVALALLDPLEPPPEQGLVHLVNSSNRRNNHSNSNHNSNHSSSSSSSRPGPDLVRLVKLSHSNRPALALADSVHSRSRSNLVASSTQAVLRSVKSPPLAHSVRVLRSNLTFVANTSKVPQPLVLVLLVPAPEPLVRRSPRLPLALVLLPNNLKLAHLALGGSVPVSSKTWHPS